ncbi:protein-tyrosine phosphatase family protein [Salinimonas sediminis]|uniref:Tyrosine specific protein phosphatases domain-containing protein n=1 Tax=Salinimonas sediminis TaxID=2303538 RepID=A0A346NJ37_9ALTE|nr:hypothetical protein [Salinimonas sediminis]AXR05544.1 hypothetical protein D0Y50_03640 [Salinimonas sediminis]
MSQPDSVSPLVTDLRWFKTSVGRICLGSRPSISAIEQLQAVPVTHVFTLQTSAEDPAELGHSVEQNHLNWRWMPFDNIRNSSQSDVAMLQQYLYETGQTLSQGGSIYLHCDTSMQRCQLFFYALCHHLRMPSASAYSVLHSLTENGPNSLSRKDLAWAADLGTSVRYQF